MLVHRILNSDASDGGHTVRERDCLIRVVVAYDAVEVQVLVDNHGRVCFSDIPEGLYAVEASRADMNVRYYPIRVEYAMDVAPGIYDDVTVCTEQKRQFRSTLPVPSAGYYRERIAVKGPWGLNCERK